MVEVVTMATRMLTLCVHPLSYMYVDLYTHHTINGEILAVKIFYMLNFCSVLIFVG